MKNWVYFCTIKVDIPVKEMIEFLLSIDGVEEENILWEATGDCYYDFTYVNRLYSFHYYPGYGFDFYCRSKKCDGENTVELVGGMIKLINMVYPDASDVIKFTKG